MAVNAVADQRMLALYAPHVAPVAARSRSVEETAGLFFSGGTWGNVGRKRNRERKRQELDGRCERVAGKGTQFFEVCVPHVRTLSAKKCVPPPSKTAYPSGVRKKTGRR